MVNLRHCIDIFLQSKQIFALLVAWQSGMLAQDLDRGENKWGVGLFAFHYKMIMNISQDCDI